MQLADPADVMLRLADVPGLRRPDSLKPERLATYCDEASGIVLLRAGYEGDDVPAPGTPRRRVLEGLAARLALLLIVGDLAGLDRDAREANTRDRQALLEEAAALATAASDQGGFFFDLTGVP